MSDFSSIMANDVLQDLVTDFRLDDLDDHFDLGLISDEVRDMVRVKSMSSVFLRGEFPICVLWVCHEMPAKRWNNDDSYP
jgi:hypothetical protein